MTLNNMIFPLSDALLKKALTHSSAAKRDNIESNERLEFLGDAVLELIISKELMERFPNADEGELSRMRANIVSEKSLSKIALVWGLDKKIKTVDPNAAKLPSVLSDAVEAIIGAVYTEHGLENTADFVLEQLSELLDSAVEITESYDYKTKLQEILQANGDKTPEYVVKSEVGEGNEKEFVIAVLFNGEELAKSSAKSKKQAGQNAAKLALESIKKNER